MISLLASASFGKGSKIQNRKSNSYYAVCRSRLHEIGNCVWGDYLKNRKSPRTTTIFQIFKIFKIPQAPPKSPLTTT